MKTTSNRHLRLLIDIDAQRGGRTQQIGECGHDGNQFEGIDGRHWRSKLFSQPHEQDTMEFDTNSENNSDKFSICPSSTPESQFSIDPFDHDTSLDIARETRPHPTVTSLKRLGSLRHHGANRRLHAERIVKPEQKLPTSAKMSQANSHRIDRCHTAGAITTFFKDMGRSLFERDGKKAQRSSFTVLGNGPQRSSQQRLPSRPGWKASKVWNSQNEYFNRLKFYAYEGGAPGFTLMHVAGSGQLAIKSVSNLCAWSAGIRPGDVLETVSDASVRGMDTEQALSLVLRSDPPSVLRFRAFRNGSTAFDSPHRFQVTLGSQKLGVQFIGDGKEQIPVVSGITNTGFRDLRLSRSSSVIQLGDVLVAVNHVDTIAIGFSKAMAVITTTERPMKLTFQRLSSELGSNLRSTDLVPGATVSFQHQDQQQRNNSRHLRNNQHRSPLTFALSQSSQTSRSNDLVRRSMIELGHMREPDADIDLGFESHGGPSKKHGSGEDILIVWKQGPLGLTLFEDDISGLPLVNRLTGKGSSTGIERLQHGFLLDSVNGIKTHGQNFANLCTGLSSMTKPVLLLFKPPQKHGGFDDHESSYAFSVNSSSSQSSCSPRGSRGANGYPASKRSTVGVSCSRNKLCGGVDHNEYKVLWDSGEKLGLVLGHAHDVDESAKSSPVIIKVRPICALHFKGVNAVGDALVAVNNLRTTGLGWNRVRLLLESVSKPTLLTFRCRHHHHNQQQMKRSSTTADSIEHRKTASLSSSDSASSSSYMDLLEKLDYEFDEGTSDSASDNETNVSTDQAFSLSYKLMWSSGRLGVTFSSYEDSDRDNAIVVFVERVRLGHAKRTSLVSIGDHLVSVNGKRVVVQTQREFHELMRSLATMSKPLVLGFQRSMVESGESSLCEDS